eukprot:scaffold14.g1329.t1
MGDAESAQQAAGPSSARRPTAVQDATRQALEHHFATFYQERVEKARRIPPDQRSSDCATFLRAAAWHEEAAAVLLDAEEGAHSEAEVLAAQLKFLTCISAPAASGLPWVLEHPQLAVSHAFWTCQIKPLMDIEFAHDGFKWSTRPPLDAAAMPWAPPIRDLPMLVHLLLAGNFFSRQEALDQAVVLLTVAHKALSNAAATAALQAQLDALDAALGGAAQGRGSSAGSTGNLGDGTWCVPPVAVLQAICLREMLAALEQAKHKEEALLAGWRNAVATRSSAQLVLTSLEHLEPDHPGTCCVAAQHAATAAAHAQQSGQEAASIQAECARLREECERHYRHGLDATRRQQSDFWVAFLAPQFAAFAALELLPSLTLPAVRELLSEGEAAARRVRRWAPPEWAATLKRAKGVVTAAALLLNAHRNAQAWDQDALERSRATAAGARGWAARVLGVC